MKNLLLTTSLVILLLGFSFMPFLYAQEVKADKIILMNGEIKEGQITAINEEDVQFMHLGETLNYRFKKSAIHKLEFASGRIETLNERISRTSHALNYQEKTVAVLPIFYIGEGNENKTDGMKYKLQQQAYTYLRKEARELKYQEPSETNALLLKNGVDDNTFRKYTSVFPI